MTRLHDIKLKYKTNNIPNQNINSKNCGWFALRFIFLSFCVLPFKIKTDFHIMNEKNTHKFEEYFKDV